MSVMFYEMISKFILRFVWVTKYFFVVVAAWLTEENLLSESWNLHVNAILMSI